MAGRVAQRPAPVAVLALDGVADPSAQRAFDATQGAVQDAQTQIRRLRSGLDETDIDVARITAFRNIEEFGAVGDGVTDSTQAIQLALNAAEGAESVVYIPTGVHVISDTLYVPNKVVLTGVGRGDTGKIMASATFPTDGRPMVRLGRVGDTLAFGTRVERLIIDGNSRAGTIIYTTCAQEQSGVRFVVATNFTQYGIHYTQEPGAVTSGAFIEDVEALPASAGATSGIFLDGNALCTVVSRVTVGVSGLLTNGLHAQSTQVLVSAFHLENCTNGINLGANSSAVLIGINPTNFLPNVTNVILASPEGFHVGIGLIRNSATNLINYGGGTPNTDNFIPLWVDGGFLNQGPTFQTYESVPSITADQDNFIPPITTNTYLMHISSDAARSITGMVLATGRVLKMRNRGAFTITLRHQNAGSLAANRFNGRGNADVLLLPGTTVELYKSTVDGCVEVMDNP